jgi:porin
VAATGGTPVDLAETAFELTYSDRITPWLSVQPDIQYIVNPGTHPAVDDVVVVGTRFTINF